MPNKIPDRLYDLDTEKAVIGSFLIDPDAIIKVADILAPDDFHDSRYRAIFETVRDLYREDVPADPVVITQRMDGQLGEGGIGYLYELADATPTAMRVIHYAKVVNRLGTLRRLMSTAGKIAKLAYNANGESLDVVFGNVRKLVDAVAPLETDKALLRWAESLDAFFLRQLKREEETKAIESGARVARVGFPFKVLQRFISYLRPGMLAIVAAESSVGKTTFMEVCAEHWAMEGLQVVFFHLELSHQFMLDRRMCRWSGEALRLIESGEITRKMDDATERLKRWTGGVHYVHCPGWTAQRIATKARQLADKGLCDVAVVDYLQKMKRVYRRGQNDASAVGTQVETLKTCGEQLGIPWLMGSQFSRASQHAERKTGKLIRDSGEPEEKANVVITLHRDILDSEQRDEEDRVVAHPGDRSPEVQVRVDKNTSGPTGDCALIMNGARFLMLDRQY
jgi:replicative DNA helicase